jgi:hypothetical protein
LACGGHSRKLLPVGGFVAGDAELGQSTSMSTLLSALRLYVTGLLALGQHLTGTKNGTHTDTVSPRFGAVFLHDSATNMQQLILKELKSFRISKTDYPWLL